MDRENPFADRYADALLRHFGHEKTFDVELHDSKQCDEVADALSRRGCTTLKFENRDRLTVRVPTNAQRRDEDEDEELRLKHSGEMGKAA